MAFRRHPALLVSALCLACVAGLLMSLREQVGGPDGAASDSLSDNKDELAQLLFPSPTQALSHAPACASHGGCRSACAMSCEAAMSSMSHAEAVSSLLAQGCCKAGPSMLRRGGPMEELVAVPTGSLQINDCRFVDGWLPKLHACWNQRTATASSCCPNAPETHNVLTFTPGGLPCCVIPSSAKALERRSMLLSSDSSSSSSSPRIDEQMQEAARGLGESFFGDDRYIAAAPPPGDAVEPGMEEDSGFGACCGAFAKAPQQQLMFKMSYQHHEQGGGWGGAAWDPYSGGGGGVGNAKSRGGDAWGDYLGVNNGRGGAKTSRARPARFTGLSEIGDMPYDRSQPYFNVPSSFTSSSTQGGGAPIRRPPAQSSWVPAHVVSGTVDGDSVDGVDGLRGEYVHAGMGDIPGTSFGQQMYAAERLERQTRREQRSLDAQFAQVRSQSKTNGPASGSPPSSNNSPSSPDLPPILTNPPTSIPPPLGDSKLVTYITCLSSSCPYYRESKCTPALVSDPSASMCSPSALVEQCSGVCHAPNSEEEKEKGGSKGGGGDAKTVIGKEGEEGGGKEEGDKGGLKGAADVAEADTSKAASILKAFKPVSVGGQTYVPVFVPDSSGEGAGRSSAITPAKDALRRHHSSVQDREDEQERNFEDAGRKAAERAAHKVLSKLGSRVERFDHMMKEGQGRMMRDEAEIRRMMRSVARDRRGSLTPMLPTGGGGVPVTQMSATGGDQLDTSTNASTIDGGGVTEEDEGEGADVLQNFTDAASEWKALYVDDPFGKAFGDAPPPTPGEQQGGDGSALGGKANFDGSPRWYPQELHTGSWFQSGGGRLVRREAMLFCAGQFQTEHEVKYCYKKLVSEGEEGGVDVSGDVAKLLGDDAPAGEGEEEEEGEEGEEGEGAAEGGEEGGAAEGGDVEGAAEGSSGGAAAK